MKKIKLLALSEGAFTIFDYDTEELTATVAIDEMFAGHLFDRNETDLIQLDEIGIMEAALGLGWIEGYYDPAYEGADYLIEERDQFDRIVKIRFGDWWDDLGDRERLIEGAITAKASLGIERTLRELLTRTAAA